MSESRSCSAAIFVNAVVLRHKRRYTQMTSKKVMSYLLTGQTLLVSCNGSGDADIAMLLSNRFHISGCVADVSLVFQKM